MLAADKDTAAQAQALLEMGDIDGAAELLIAWRARRRIEEAAESDLEVRLGESLPACESLMERTLARLRAGEPDALCGDVLRVARLLADLGPSGAAGQLGLPAAELRRLERYDLTPIRGDDAVLAEAVFNGLCVIWRRGLMRRRVIAG